jgi:hypothetical protein
MEGCWEHYNELSGPYNFENFLSNCTAVRFSRWAHSHGVSLGVLLTIRNFQIYKASAGIKRSGPETDHSPSSNAEVKKDGSAPPLPHMSSWLGA